MYRTSLLYISTLRFATTLKSPTEHFCNFRATKNVDQRFQSTWDWWIGVFYDSRIAKCTIGRCLKHAGLTIPKHFFPSIIIFYRRIYISRYSIFRYARTHTRTKEPKRIIIFRLWSRLSARGREKERKLVFFCHHQKHIFHSPSSFFFSLSLPVCLSVCLSVCHDVTSPLLAPTPRPS